ncbi:MAG TPA: branched-chain amino acid ABC transporter permease [Gaiellaceae bacterium]|nr:branched-chain amino acid ABC transporter permease [Gaiellaceae bacterium]
MDAVDAAPFSPTTMRRQLGERVASLVLLLVLVSAVTGLASLGSAVLQNVLVNMLINLMLVVGLYIFVGNTGVFSFGHIGFMAIGAYTAGIVRIPTESKLALLQLPSSLEHAHLSSFEAVLLGGAVATAAAIVVALPLMRLGGLTAGLGTFAVLNIINIVAANWNAFTGGSTGMAGVPTTTGVSDALGWALVAIVIAWLFQQTRVCLRVRASREDEPAARALGMRLIPDRSVAFVLSAFVCGAAGGLYGQLAGSFGPSAFFLPTTFTVVAMLVVGGRYSLSGAVVGALFLATISEGLRRLEGGFHVGPLHVPGRPGLQEVGLAVALLLTLLLRPRGLTGGNELGPEHLRRLARFVARPQQDTRA